MRVLLILCTALWVLHFVPLAQAVDKDPEPDVWSRGCGDDQGTDRCDPQILEKMRSTYGWQSVQELADKKITARRAMIIDGYGRDIVGISFERHHDNGPFVEIRTPRHAGEQRQPLRAFISEGVWADVLQGGTNFDQALARESEDNSDSICLHGWVAVVDAVDYSLSRSTVTDKDGTARQREEPQSIIRSDTESACTKGLAIPYAFQLADLARTALSECSSLKKDDFRNSPMLIAVCANLRGDRLAASKAYAVTRSISGSSLEELQSMFAYYAKGKADELHALVANDNVYLDAPYASGPDMASVKGLLYREDSDGKGQKVADIAIIMTGEYDSFQITSFTVGDFKSVKESD